eukprot:8410175-Alexandrium_andersonii.AAC.1
MQHRLRRNGLKNCPRSSGGVLSAHLIAQVPNPPTAMGLERGPKSKHRKVRNSTPAVRQSAICT